MSTQITFLLDGLVSEIINQEPILFFLVLRLCILRSFKNGFIFDYQSE